MPRKSRNSKAVERTYRILTHYWYSGLAVAITTALGLIFGASDISTVYKAGVIEAAQVTVVLLLSLFWFFSYVHATLCELEMLKDYSVAPSITAGNWAPLAMVMVISVSFGFLLSQPTNLRLYAGVGVLLLCFNAIGFTFVQRSVINASSSIQGDEEQLWAIVQYYLHRPFLLHQIGWVVGFFLVLFLSTIAEYNQRPNLDYVATGILFLTISMGEYVLFRWRRVRDSGLLESSKNRDDTA